MGWAKRVVQGSVTPDEYYVFKPTLKAGFKPILDKRLGSKQTKMVYDTGKLTKTVSVDEADRQKFALSDEEILTLGRWTCIIEDHYSAVHGKETPMDIEWAKDGQTGQLFIVQARPETVQSRKSGNILRTYKADRPQGRAAVHRSRGRRSNRSRQSPESYRMSANSASSVPEKFWSPIALTPTGSRL